MSGACPTFGFEATFIERDNLSDEESDALWSDFIEFVESRGLLAAGGGDDGEWSHILTGDGTQAVDADRDAFLRWAESHAMIASAKAGPLVDVG